MASTLHSSIRGSPGADDAVVDSLSRLSLFGPTDRRWVVDEVLRPRLRMTHDYELITADNECFAPAREFRKRWCIAVEPWDNFVRLLCGHRQFPFVLLQNPSKEHHKNFEQMRLCPTVDWLSEMLNNVGLSLHEVPILDICVLFSDEDLQAMDKERKSNAVEAAYRLVEEILGILRPSVIICCQCVTWGRWKDGREVWERAENNLARQLCSSTRDAQAREAISIDLEDHRVWAVKGFHPCYSLRVPGSMPVLEELFRDMYEPCAIWKARLFLRRLEDLSDATDGVISAMGTLKGVLKYLRLDGRLEEASSRCRTGLKDCRDSMVLLVQSLKVYAEV